MGMFMHFDWVCIVYLRNTSRDLTMKSNYLRTYVRTHPIVQPGSPQKETKEKAAATSSSSVLPAQERVFGNVSPIMQHIQPLYIWVIYNISYTD